MTFEQQILNFHTIMFLLLPYTKIRRNKPPYYPPLRIWVWGISFTLLPQNSSFPLYNISRLERLIFCKVYWWPSSIRWWSCKVLHVCKWWTFLIRSTFFLNYHITLSSKTSGTSLLLDFFAVFPMKYDPATTANCFFVFSRVLLLL